MQITMHTIEQSLSMELLHCVMGATITSCVWKFQALLGWAHDITFHSTTKAQGMNGPTFGVAEGTQ